MEATAAAVGSADFLDIERPRQALPRAFASRRRLVQDVLSASWPLEQLEEARENAHLWRNPKEV
jgi:hypothetical protein